MLNLYGVNARCQCNDAHAHQAATAVTKHHVPGGQCYRLNARTLSFRKGGSCQRLWLGGFARWLPSKLTTGPYQQGIPSVRKLVIQPPPGKVKLLVSSSVVTGYQGKLKREELPKKYI